MSVYNPEFYWYLEVEDCRCSKCGRKFKSETNKDTHENKCDGVLK